MRSDTLATREGLTDTHQRIAPERMEGSQKKGAHEAPALLTKIWPQRRERVTKDSMPGEALD
jgi:hypothetical protein